MIIWKVPILIDDLVADSKLIFILNSLDDTWCVCLLCVYWFYFSHFSFFPQGDWILEIVVSLKHSYSPGSLCLYNSRLLLPLCFLIRVSLGIVGKRGFLFEEFYLGARNLNSHHGTHSAWSTPLKPFILHFSILVCLCMWGPNLEIVTVIREPTRRSKNPPNLLWIPAVEWLKAAFWSLSQPCGAWRSTLPIW